MFPPNALFTFRKFLGRWPGTPRLVVQLSALRSRKFRRLCRPMFRLLFRLRSNSRLRHNDWTAIVRHLASFPLSTRWRRVPKNSSYRQILKKGSLGQRSRDAIRPTPKAWRSRRQPLSSVGRIASLLVSPLEAISRPFSVFRVRQPRAKVG